MSTTITELDAGQSFEIRKQIDIDGMPEGWEHCLHRVREIAERRHRGG